MPPTLHIRLLARPWVLSRLSRAYSTAQKPLIKVHDVQAPNTGRIRILSLARPEARNAISKQLLWELRNNIDSIAGEYAPDGSEVPVEDGENKLGPTRAVVIASEVDSCFCAGADLKERKGMTPDETEAFLTVLRSTFVALSALPIPTISAISSVALGGGLELALSTHFRVMASTATIGLPETRLGIIPGAGGTYRLPSLIGMSRARDLILTGRRVSAAEAYFLGIADRLVEVVPTEGEENAATMKRAGDEALAAAVSLASDICEGGPIAVRSALQAVSWAREEVENKMYDQVVGTADRNEALKAFSEKRKPVFTGR